MDAYHWQKKQTLTRQEHKCAITQQKLHGDTNLFDYDHKDGNNQNIHKDNCQAIIVGAHRIKTNNKDKYKAIKKNPQIYNIDIILNCMNTPEFKAELESFNGNKIKINMMEVFTKMYNEIPDQDKKYMNNNQETINEIFT